jgi:radical SAM protein with 4Fe4S-binding SPASM domain
MAVAPDGTVIPCQSWLRENSGLGNLLTDNWKTIWNRPLCKKLRSMTEKEAEACPFRKEARHG